MKTIDRYILRSFFVAFVSTITALLALYLAIHGFTHVSYVEVARETFAREGYSLASGFATYYAVHIPEILVFVGPHALLMASMFTVHSLNQSNELVPLFAAGVSRARILLPVFLGAAVVTIGLVVVKEVTVPRLADDMTRLARAMRGRTDDVVNDLGLIRDGRGNIIQPGVWDVSQQCLENVYIWTPRLTKPAHFDRLDWVSDSGGGTWRAQPTDAVAQFDPSRDTDLVPYDLAPEQRAVTRLSFEALRRLHERSPAKRHLAVILHEHLTYPLTPFVLLFFGLPLVMRSRKKNVFQGLGLCLVLSLGFFSMTQILHRLGSRSEIISPALAAWLPVIVFGAIGLVIFDSND
ncbi:MAG: LptF/LptG family permease [Planctomycetes bacterium]|nr:LptF/LptG family permease [Planctomycetota bacterium]